MTTKQIEALKLALEALEYYADMAEEPSTASGAALIVRKALAERERHQDWCASLTQMLTSMPPKPAPCNCKQPAPVAEPVAWANPNDLQNFDMKVRTNGGPLHTVPLYTSPQPSKQWVGLTEEDREQHRSDWLSNIHDKEFHAIEAKLREKNT